MWAQPAEPETPCMSPLAAPVQQQQSSVGYLSVRVHQGDDAAELQRRLEACLLIARSVAPAVLLPAAS